MGRYPKYTTTVIGAYSVPDWFEPLEKVRKSPVPPFPTVRRKENTMSRAFVREADEIRPPPMLERPVSTAPNLVTPRGARLSPTRRPGLDRCGTQPAPRRAHLHLLGLLAECLWPQCRTTHRPFIAQPTLGKASNCRRRGSGGAWPGQGQRPCTDLDRAFRARIPPKTCPYIQSPAVGINKQQPS
jgi:hypothetical protein